jgi:tetratricopeptide (TPR) repeat protein
MFKRLRTKEAIEIYKDYLNAHPDSSRVAFILAQALKENGDYQSALSYLRQSMELLPGDGSVSDFSRNFIRNHIPQLLEEIKPHISNESRC